MTPGNHLEYIDIAYFEAINDIISRFPFGGATVEFSQPCECNSGLLVDYSYTDQGILDQILKVRCYNCNQQVSWRRVGIKKNTGPLCKCDLDMIMIAGCKCGGA